MAVIPPEAIIIVVAIISALAGGVFAWIVGNFGAEDESRPPEKVEAPPEAGEQPLLSVSQEGDELAVFVRGHRYYHLRGITDPQSGRDAVQAVKAVLAFVEGWLPALQRSQPQSPLHPQPKSQPKPQPQPRPTSQRSSAEARSFLEQLRESDLFPSKPTPSPSPAPMQPLTVVGEIDDLVQEKLKARPDLEQKRVRLTTDIHGDLLIYVGKQRFHSADDITDTEIRNLIQDAIHEWESR